MSLPAWFVAGICASHLPIATQNYRQYNINSPKLPVRWQCMTYKGPDLFYDSTVVSFHVHRCIPATACICRPNSANTYQGQEVISTDLRVEQNIQKRHIRNGLWITLIQHIYRRVLQPNSFLDISAYSSAFTGKLHTLSANSRSFRGGNESCPWNANWKPADLRK